MGLFIDIDIYYRFFYGECYLNRLLDLINTCNNAYCIIAYSLFYEWVIEVYNIDILLKLDTER